MHDTNTWGALNSDSDEGSVDSPRSQRFESVTSVKVTMGKSSDVVKWEKLYCDLEKSVARDDFKQSDKLCETLCDESRWSANVLHRPWSKMETGGIRKWAGDNAQYPNAYRVIDGIREAWVCLLMDNCSWDKAIRVCDRTVFDEKCLYLSSKAQIALNKLHALMESRRMREAFGFLQQLLDSHPKMAEIHKVIERMHGYQWHYTMARIHFLHNELEKAQQHSEAACSILDANRSCIEEPLQTRLWVNMIRAWTQGLSAIVSKSAKEVGMNLDLWEKTVCDLDRKALSSTVGLKEAPTFGRLKFVEFLMIAIRAFPEIRVSTYQDTTRPENANVISIGKLLLGKLRSVSSELLSRGKVSVEATNPRYNPILDQALMQLGYLSTTLKGLINNWALVIDAGPMGNEGRFANHADDPNAVLAIGLSSGIRVRVLKCVKRINPGDEITVHYGCDYWDTLSLHKRKESHPPGIVRNVSTMPNISKKNSLETANSSIVQLNPVQEPFTYFDGFVCDLNGSGLPGKLLLQILGETSTSADMHDMERASLRKGIRVVDCPKTHAAFPGKMLVADKAFCPGDEICVYAGILCRIPESQLKLNDSDYISTVCSMTTGAYGFELEDIGANSGMTFKRIQHEIPTLTPALNGTLIPDAIPASDLSGIHDIRGLGPEFTRAIIQNLQNPQKRNVMARLLTKLRNLPDKNWKTNAITEIKRALPVVKRPIDAISASETSTALASPTSGEILDSPHSMDEPQHFPYIPHTLLGQAVYHDNDQYFAEQPVKQTKFSEL